jgi:hypothetical protein
MAERGSYPSPREAVGREGRREAEARVGGLCSGDTPHPDARFARVDPPHHSLRSWGEGSERAQLLRKREGNTTELVHSTLFFAEAISHCRNARSFGGSATPSGDTR